MAAGEPPGIKSAGAEFIQLREQKAADWRFVSQVNLSMLAATGAIFTAALTTDASAWLFVFAAIPLFLGLLHMAAQGHLHQRMIAFLVEAAKEVDTLDYEGRLVRVKQALSHEPTRLRDQLVRPTAVRVWLLIAISIGLTSTWFPVLAELEHRSCLIASTGTVIVALFSVWIGWYEGLQSSERERWQERWRRSAKD
jgi:hypothetical protein